MKHYEETLSKIAPVYYKFISYDNYFFSSIYTKLLRAYLFETKLANTKNIVYFFPFLSISENYINYLFHSWFGHIERRTKAAYLVIMLDKISLHKDLNIHPFISDAVIDMVINNFSFEKLKLSDNPTVTNKTFKDLFITLVGEDMYETIRSNIR